MAFWFIASLASCSASSWSLSVYRLVGLLFFVSSWLLSGLSPRRPLGSHCLVYRLVGLMFALVLFACWFIALSASCFTSSWLPSRLSPCWPRVLFSHLVVIFLVYRLLGLVFCTLLVASCFIALSALLFACSGLPFCLSPRRPCLQFSFVCFSGLSPRRPCLHSLVIYLIHIIACHHLFRLKGRFLSSPRSGIAITICLVSCCFFTRSLAIVFSPHHHFWDRLFVLFSHRSRCSSTRSIRILFLLLQQLQSRDPTRHVQFPTSCNVSLSQRFVLVVASFSFALLRSASLLFAPLRLTSGNGILPTSHWPQLSSHSLVVCNNSSSVCLFTTSPWRSSLFIATQTIHVDLFMLDHLPLTVISTITTRR